MPKPIKLLHPSTAGNIGVRGTEVFQALRARGLNTERDLGHALAAVKMVVAVLEARAWAIGLPQEALDKADELAGDLEDVVEFLGLDIDEVGGRVH